MFYAHVKTSFSGYQTVAQRATNRWAMGNKPLGNGQQTVGQWATNRWAMGNGLLP
jgi:hypothetical protein